MFESTIMFENNYLTFKELNIKTEQNLGTFKPQRTEHLSLLVNGNY